jgi:hypothetical protein
MRRLRAGIQNNTQVCYLSLLSTNSHIHILEIYGIKLELFGILTVKMTGFPTTGDSGPVAILATLVLYMERSPLRGAEHASSWKARQSLKTWNAD